MRAALVFCVLYAVVAVMDRPSEKFPFFAWDLFSTVPGARAGDYSVRITSETGRNMTLPVYYENSGLQVGGPEVQGFTALQTLGKAIQSGDKSRVEALRRSFESTYLGALSNVHYEVVKRSFDIRQRVECRSCFTKETVIATYETG